MEQTNKIANPEPIKSYLEKNNRYFSISKNDIEIFFLKKIIRNHPYEALTYKIDGIDIITPRGIDYFQDVIIPYFYKCSLEYKEKNYLDKRKMFDQLDLEWTNKWINFISKNKKSIDDFIPDKDIKTRDFYKQYDIKSIHFKYCKDKYPEIEQMIYQYNRYYIIKKEFVNILLKNYMTEYLLKYLSKWISKNIENDIESYSIIHIKKFPEMEKQKYKIKQINMEKEKTKIKNKPQLINVKKNFSNILTVVDLTDIKKILADKHPHEKMIYKIWDTNESNAGELYFTMHGADWYTRIYLRIKSEQKNKMFYTSLNELLLEKEWMENLLKKENVPLDSELDNEYNKMIFIYQLKTKNHMEKIFKILGVTKSLEELTKEDYMIAEEKNPTFTLRRYSYLFSKTDGYKESIIQFINPVKNEHKNIEWEEIDNCPSGWYYGKIINKPYYHGKGKCEVLVVNVQLDNGKKIKVRVPSILYRKTKIQLLYVAHMSIRFFIEDINVEGELHHKVKQIILGKQIGFIPNWDESPMYYVPIPRVGKPRIEDIDTKYLKDEYRKKEEEKKYAIK